jgi:methylthioribose-1-phosphate isomerase
MSFRTIDWVDDGVVLIDQTVLPHAEEWIRIEDAAAMVDAIKRLAIRGAPAIGVAGAYGVALAARVHPAGSAELEEAVRSLRSARPTAANLAHMVDRAAAVADQGFDRVLQEANAIRDEEIAASLAMGGRGADLVQELVTRRPIRTMTICNTGGLASVERGTALAVIRTLHERGVLEEALVLETRPVLQGSRLTTWELQRLGVPHRLLVDGAGPPLVARGLVDVVLTGADRIAANGDVANKIGTFGLALGARWVGTPFVVVAPETTVDAKTPSGAGIQIEDRGASEVVEVAGRVVAPAGTAAVNPAFDVTPVDLVTALVTDRRVVRFEEGESMATHRDLA